MFPQASLNWRRRMVLFRWNPPSHWERGIISIVAGLFPCTGVIFAWRRLSGALISPLSTALLITTGLLMVIIVLGIRALWRRSSAREDYSHGDLILDALLGASLLIFAAALSLRGTNAWGLGLFWLLLLAEEIWTWQAQARRLIAR